VLAHWQMFERQRLADFARVAFFTAWQFYCSIYLGVFLVYLLAALTVAIFLVRRPVAWQNWDRSSNPATIALVLLSALALAYLLGSYFMVWQRYELASQRLTGHTDDLLPRLWSYFNADSSWLLHRVGRSFDLPARWEHQLFIGFGAIALIVTAWRSRAAVPELTKVMLIALALLIAGTLWIADLSLYYLVSWLPGIKGIRAVTRIIIVMLMPMSVLVALGVDAVGRRFGRSARTAVPALAVVVALVVVEPLTGGMGATPIAKWRERLDTLKALLPRELPGDAILLVRTNSREFRDMIHAELDAMLLGQDLDRPVLNGYSAFEPPGYQLRPCPRAEPRFRYAKLFLGADAARDYARRLVVLDLGSCPAPGAQTHRDQVQPQAVAVIAPAQLAPGFRVAEAELD